MSAQDDRTFLLHFSLIIVGLVVFTVLIIILSVFIHGQVAPSENPAREAAREQRIAPLADVYAGETGRAAAQAAAETAAPATAAFDGSLDAEMIYSQVCQVCHQTGAGGAPLMTAEDWGGRLDKDESELISSVINGLGAMPPRAGRPDLTDEQIEVTVEYMLDMLQ